MRALTLIVCPVLFLDLAAADDVRLSFPETRRVDQVDVYHGREVSDPYRWLEADPRESSEVAEWIAAENRATRAYLDSIPKRDEIRAKLADLWNYERFSPPWKVGPHYFYYKNSGLQNQSVLYVSDDYRQPGRVLIDPNAWTEDGTAALGSLEVSNDGRLLAYLRKDAGSDWSTIRVIDVAEGEELDDSLQWARHGNVVWNAAANGFYYTRYPEPPPGEKFQALSLDPAIYFHRLGDPQSADERIFAIPEHPRWSFWLSRTEDDRYLVMSIYRSTDPQNRVYVRPAAAPDQPWHRLIDDFQNEFHLIGNEGDQLYFLTDLEAPTKRVVALKASGQGRADLAEIVPAAESTLEDVTLMDQKLICQYLKDVVAQVLVYGLDGTYLNDVELPGAGSVAGFGGREKDQETFFSFANYVTPSLIFRYDVHLGESEQIRASKIDFDASHYVSRQAFYSSQDGTSIPITVSHRADLEPTGDLPTLLYGYGGFSIALPPRFSIDYAAWMEMGGVLAVPNFRGGGEYGEPWHLAGKALNKQNVFDDFIAAAQWLIEENYTRPEKLAVMGGSNGGLLVGAVMTQRPDLFGACLPAVGVLDMLRYNQFTAGHFWRDEYGTPDDPQQFEVLLSYSPYHNVRPGAQYPATLVTTADTDDRVVPMHSFKFAAALQAAQAGNAPILLRVETRAGHGAGTPTSKRIDLAADKWAFLWKTLGMGRSRLSGDTP